LSLFIDTVTIDCADPRRLAAFWSEALDYAIDEVDDDGALILDRVDEAGRGGAVYFQRVPEGKVAKNRVHLDLRPSTSMAAEVARLALLGATEQRLVDEGDGAWTVMLDPEGNELCVLRGPDDGWSPS